MIEEQIVVLICTLEVMDDVLQHHRVHNIIRTIFDRRKYINTTTTGSKQKCERRENRIRLDHRLDDIMDNSNDNVYMDVLTYPFTSNQIILTIMMMRIIVLVNW
jgi:hypothetical protein